MTSTWCNADSLSQYNRIQPKNEYFWQGIKSIDQSDSTIRGRKMLMWWRKVQVELHLVHILDESLDWQ
jgi:hypothetical protein